MLEILTVIVVFSFTKISLAQKDVKGFEGQINYGIEYLGELDPATKAQAPTEIIMYFKGVKARMEQTTAMGKVVVITDNTTMEQIVLLDMMGNKWAIKSTKEETQKALEEVPKATIKTGDGTKTIAGLSCKQVFVTQSEKTDTFWVTNDLVVDKPNWNMPWSEISGVLMEYAQNQNDISMKISAKEVKKTKIKDIMFTIPSEYQQMTSEEFRNMFGGGE